MRRLRDARTRWFLLAGLWIVVLVLGVGGFIQQGHANEVGRPLLDTLYLTLQLATLDYDGSTGPMNWRLQVGRFVVPIMAASTVLQTASTVFSREFDRFRMRFARDHTVVCGLGDTGSRIAQAFEAAGERVIAVDADAAVTGAARTSGDGIEVLDGDAADVTVLRAAGVHKAARVVVVCGSDAANVAVVAAVGDAVTDRRGKALRVAVQLTDADLTALLRSQDLGADGGLRVSYFNLHERAARALLGEHPPFSSEAAGSADAGATGASPRPMVVGMGQLGRSLVVALCQQWAEARPGQRMPLVLVDQTASGRWASLLLQHPALADVCDPTLIDLDLEDPSAGSVVAFDRLLAEDRPSWVAVVVDSETLALANAVFLHQRLPQGEVPIVVRMRAGAGLGTLLAPRPGAESAFPGVSVFPFLDRTCTVETVDGGIREQLAQAVHEDYLAHLPPHSATGDLNRPWAELDDDQRDQSRRRVDGIIADLDAIGCDLVPLRRWGAPALTMTPAEEDLLAAREHQRWFDDRTAAGWTHAPVRDNARKQNPMLVPWPQLDLDTQVTNIEAIQALPSMLARAGFEAVRR